MTNDRNQTASAILKAAIAGLETTENDNTPLDDFLDSHFETDPAMIRSAVTNLLFTYYRRKGLIDHLISTLAPKAKNRYRRLLAVAVTQMCFNRGINPSSAANVAVYEARRRFGAQPAGFINAVLRRVGETNLEELEKKLTAHARLSLAPELLAQWQKHLSPAEIDAIAIAAREKPPVTFRLRCPIPSAELDAIGAQKISLPEWVGKQQFYEIPSLQPLLDGGWMERGLVYVQDPAAAMAPEMAELTPDMAVLDLCAAPGGKSLILAEKLHPGKLTAADRSERRQLLTAENFRNGNLDQQVVVADALQPPFPPESFDLVLIDVPCSNTGVGRHRPDVWWNFSQRKLAELTALQQKIMLQAAVLVKRGGLLIYSTCSIEDEEDRRQVDFFLSHVPGFVIEQDRRLLPNRNHDGAYAARLRRIQ